MLKNEKALVVFSGGQDSTTCLFWALDTFESVTAVTFDYGQRHALEIEVAKNICKEQNISHHILDMSLIGALSPNALTHHDVAIVHEEALPSTFVPGRNLLFMSFAGALAYSLGIKHLVTGVSESDFSGYPDCRDSFIKSLNVTLNLAMEKDFVIHTPLMWRDKAAVWQLADELGQLDYVKNNTLTCYEGVMASGCGACPACELRNNGLKSYIKTLEEST